MLFHQFDKIRIINLAHRNDRRQEIAAQLRRFGVEIDGERVAFFNAVQTVEANGFYSVGAHGCYLSHLTLLEEAKGSILILEDDCDFTSAAATYIVPDCEIFYGGYYANDPAAVLTSDIVGAHMMGYFQPRIIGAYLRNLLKTEAVSFDGAIVWYRRAHPEAKTVFANPILAYQRASRTDIGTPIWLDRFPVVANAARRLKRLVQQAS